MAGPGPSVMDISPVLANKDRVVKERNTIKQKYARGGDDFVHALANLDHDLPNFLVDSVFSQITVICLQTPWMRGRLLSPEVPDEPVNGIVSDAAHQFWRNKNDVVPAIKAASEPCFCAILA
ncbi:hypothetical protein PM082_017587 [Marasmius tenuissimus]|nr:hypothetical protein PM082_017587 [Marasmius tenuissimus]